MHGMGLCPAVVEDRLEGEHGGTNAGRACWVVDGTLCNGKVQGTFAEKFKDCQQCAFYKAVREEEFPAFKRSITLLTKLRTSNKRSEKERIMSREPTVLVADGSDTCMYLSIVLNRMNFLVITVRNGLRALEVARVAKPDVVLLDIDIPGENGVAVLKKLKGDVSTSDIPVIMMSAKESDKIRSECENCRCDGFINKPLSIEKLHRELERNIRYPGGSKRRYLRSSWENKVCLDHGGRPVEYESVSLSEGGMYIKGDRRFPVGTKVLGSLPLKDNIYVNFRGSVIYMKGKKKEMLDIEPGMAIEFKDFIDGDQDMLKDYIVGLLTNGESGLMNHICCA
jgi:CheY-like chemotaxis protein